MKRNLNPLALKYYLAVLLTYSTGLYLIIYAQEVNKIYSIIIMLSSLLLAVLDNFIIPKLYKEKKTIITFISVNITTVTLGYISPTLMVLINGVISLYWGNYAYNYQNKK